MKEVKAQWKWIEPELLQLKSFREHLMNQTVLGSRGMVKEATTICSLIHVLIISRAKQISLQEYVVLQ